MIDYKFGQKVTVCRGRFKGETVMMIGETNLNMDHRIICRREKGRDKMVGIYPDNLIAKG